MKSALSKIGICAIYKNCMYDVDDDVDDYDDIEWCDW